MLKRLDKKAQNTQFVVLLLVGLIAAGLVIWLVYTYIGPAANVPGTLPTHLTLREKVCAQADSGMDTFTYCDEFFEEESKRYINCDGIKNKYQTSFEDSEIKCTMEDGSETIQAAEVTQCEKIKRKEGNKYDGSKYFVNDKACKDVLNSNSGGGDSNPTRSDV